MEGSLHNAPTDSYPLYSPHCAIPSPHGTRCRTRAPRAQTGRDDSAICLRFRRHSGFPHGHPPSAFPPSLREAWCSPAWPWGLTCQPGAPVSPRTTVSLGRRMVCAVHPPLLKPAGLRGQKRLAAGLCGQSVRPGAVGAAQTRSPHWLPGVCRAAPWLMQVTNDPMTRRIVSGGLPASGPSANSRPPPRTPSTAAGPAQIPPAPFSRGHLQRPCHRRGHRQGPRGRELGCSGSPQHIHVQGKLNKNEY